MVEQPTGTVTLLFTDIEGSTRLLDRLGPERYREALELHRGLLRRSFKRHNGYEVDYEGDAFFIAFARAKDAVAAAATGQQALASADWPDGQEIRVRIGIHTGEPLAAPPKYVGLDVHKAARIMAAGHGGQVLVSEATTRLLEGVEMVGLGEHRLKDLLQPEPLHQLLIAGLQSEFPALKTLGNRPNNLPIQPNPLIGREVELAQVTALLRDHDVRLVTLTGPGGTGKTRLALQVAAELLDDFASGAFFVSLAPIRDPALVIPSVAQALAVREVPGEDIPDTLAAYLEQKQMLLVLDNFEQVIGAAADVARLLDRCENLRLAVTSRERLRLRGERMYAVPPLALVDPAADLGALLGNEAVALFAARADAATGGFTLDERNASVVAAICARLDGLPLAIELAAGRTSALAVEALLARLDQRLPLLSRGARDADERQQTLRSAIDWSYELLLPQERTLFASFGVFVGGCRIEAVEAVCDHDGTLSIGILDGVTSLLDKNLIRRRDDPDGQPRYWMLETIREYAEDRLDLNGERYEVEQRHLRFFLDLVENLGRLSLGPGEPSAFARLSLERDNLRAVLGTAVEQRDGAAALRLVSGVVQRFWRLQGHLVEGREWVELALGLGSVEPGLRAEGLLALANIAGVQGDADAVAAAASEALPICRQVDVTRTINCLNSLGIAMFLRGDLEKARGHFEEVELLARDTGDAFWLSRAVSNLGEILFYEGEHEQAQRRYAESAALSRDLGLVHEGLVAALGNEGFATLQLGSPQRAARLFGESIEAARVAGDIKGVISAAIGLAAVLADQGDPTAAILLLSGAKNTADRRGYQLEPFEQQVHNRTLEKLRAVMSDDELAAGSEAAAVSTEQDLIARAVAGAASASGARI